MKEPVSADTHNGVKKPHLLIYAHYYHPDTASTGQILKELAEGLLSQFRVTVVCVVPSYLGTIEAQWKTQNYYRETINGVNVIRVRVPEFTKTNKKSRVKNILAYFFRAMRAGGKAGKVDYVLTVSQPPILGGLLGVWGKWTLRTADGKRPKFIYQIQDFNPEQVLAVGYSKNKAVTDLMMALDKFSCRQSDLVITVGRDLVETLRRRFGVDEKQGAKEAQKTNKTEKHAPKAALINNWIDEKEIYPLPTDHPRVLAFKKKYGLLNEDGSSKFVIMYSGNIGLYYDLENLLKVIERFPPGTKTVDGKEVVFAFVGAGSVLDKLVMYQEAHHMDNVVFIPYQDKADLIYSLNAGDVHWCVNAKGIKGVSCPSKYYGLAAAARPVLGVLETGAEVRCLIEETKGGLCSEPGDYEQTAKNIQWFLTHADSKELKEMGQRSHENLLKNLTRERSVEKYAEAILGCGK